MDSRCSSVRKDGKTTETLTRRLPKLAGSSRKGMPSPLSMITCWCLVTPLFFSTTICPSRCRTFCVHPKRASRRVIDVSMWRSSPLRWNFGCFFTFKLKMTLPGSMPGRWSVIRGKVILSPSCMPFSMFASRRASSCLHFSLLGTSCCCCVRKGPICTFTTLISFGHFPHPLHWGAPGRRRQPLQTTRLETLTLCVPPKYKSSRETSYDAL
mmetsp:Transcript_28767/g.79251  ORF Transcript_28767/g.79251 Transcript_28767/m.79251 type:complete len:211 (+) Transcript_28767:178-810(+)